MISSSEFRPVKTPRAFEEIAAQLRERLSQGRLKVGERLPPEKVLAEQLGVSRNTIREALRLLEYAGLLELRKGSGGGAFVRAGDGGTIVTSMLDMYRLGAIVAEDLTEARIWIGSIAVRVACERATEEDIRALQDNVAQAERALDEADFFTQAEILLDFHRLLALATKNKIMEIVTEAVTHATLHFIRAIGPYPTRDILPSRKRLLRDIAARDSAAAVAEMEKHLRRVHRYYLARHATEGQA